MSNDSGLRIAEPDGPTINVLTEFLLARIAEDEAMASEGGQWSEHMAAICQGHRQIVLLAESANEIEAEASMGLRGAGQPYVGDLILRQLALPYAAHPDYRQEWRA